MSKKVLDLTGQAYGRLLVVGPAPQRITREGKKRNYWLCKCVCNTLREISTSTLNSGHTRSCGCLSKELLIHRNKSLRLSEKELLESQQKTKLRKQQYRKDNSVKIKERLTRWRDRNRERISTSRREYEKRRRDNDIIFWTKKRLRTRLQKVLKNKNSYRTVELYGCSPAEMTAHIESLFVEGMSWENRSEWHLDHIRPLSSFDLTDAEQLKQACHYTNIQPLWAVDNMRKSDKWEESPCQT